MNGTKTAAPTFNTAQDVYDYLASIGETAAEHTHLWVRWDAWDDWGWRPHVHTPSALFVCDVPGCIVVRTERV